MVRRIVTILQNLVEGGLQLASKLCPSLKVEVSAGRQAHKGQEKDSSQHSSVTDAQGLSSNKKLSVCYTKVSDESERLGC